MTRIAKNRQPRNSDGGNNTAKVLRLLGLDPANYDLFDMFEVTTVVSKEQAKKVLETYNTRNRKISGPHVGMLQRDMDAGKFSNIAPVLFDRNGIMMDGQHRFMAASKSKCPVQFTIKFNRPESDRHKVDQNRARVTADTLAMDPDILHGCHIPAIYKGALLGQALDFKTKADWEACCGQHRRNLKLSPDEAKEVYLKYQDGFDFVTRLFHEPCNNQWSKSGVIRGAFLRAYLCDKRNKPHLEKIIRYLVSPSTEDNMFLVRAIERFDGQQKSAEAKTVKGKISLYGLTERLISIFCQDERSLNNSPKLTATKDELFPFPSFDMRKPGESSFISGKDKRRKARESLQNALYLTDDEFDDVA